jgi:hypothetical protein
MCDKLDRNGLREDTIDEGKERQVNERGRREVVFSGPLVVDHGNPLVIDNEGRGRQAHDGTRRPVSKGRKKKTSKVKEEKVNSVDNRPDVRDFIVRVIGAVTSGALVVYIVWLCSLPKRSMFIFAPIGIAYFIAFVIVGRRIRKNNEKRRRKGKRYKFMDVEHQSGWITALAMISMVGGMLVFLMLYMTRLLTHYWYLAIPVALLTLAGIIFSPERAGQILDDFAP